MNKLMITVATVALLAGQTAASAQTGYTTGGSWRQNSGAAQSTQTHGSRTQVAQNTRRDRTGRQGQTQTQTQTQGSPDWAAYYRNNPDLQREYEANRNAYQAQGESADAYAARHYREHGQAEGRALPRSAVVAQPTPQPVQPGGGQRRSDDRDGRFTPRGDDRDGRSGRDFGQRGDQWRDEGLRRDRGTNRNWQDWNRRYGDQSRSYRRQGGYAWDGRNWRPEQFNRRDYNRNRFAERRFRLSPYYRLPGWSYQRWTFGQFLPFVFFSQNYWVDSYWSYGLPVPPYGCEWVRYGDDALLVDVETGEILQVVYNLFY